MVRYVRAGTYATNAANTNACPAGYSKITTAATCQAAAGLIGKTYSSSVDQSDRPSGCYFFDSLVGAIVRLNTHLTGGADPNSQPLCKGTGVAPTPAHLRAAAWVVPRAA